MYVLIVETLKRKRKISEWFNSEFVEPRNSQFIFDSYCMQVRAATWATAFSDITTFFSQVWLPPTSMKKSMVYDFSLDFWTYGCKWLNGHREINMWLFVHIYPFIVYLWHHLMDIPQSHDVNQLNSLAILCMVILEGNFVFIPMTGVIL